MAKKKKPDKKKSTGKKRETLRQIYARIKREFSAADLQKFTEIEEGVPADLVLAEMEAINQKFNARKKG